MIIRSAEHYDVKQLTDLMYFISWIFIKDLSHRLKRYII
ncbi:hypothetical protein B4140_0697 [Bacillus amyloliquefaciens]|nr:hypothetical protein B4140_0697 [Bacillus amyloliquefaciens]